MTTLNQQSNQQNAMSEQRLQEQNQHFRGTGGVSQENRSLGFLPAFADTKDGKIYLSRFADGCLAPMHLLNGLPKNVLDSVEAGFVRDGHFYTREQASAIATRH